MAAVNLRLAGHYVRVTGVAGVPNLTSFLNSMSVDTAVSESPSEIITVQRNNDAFSCFREGDSSPYYTAKTVGDFLLLFERTLLNLFLEYLPATTLVFHASAFYENGRLLGFLGEPDSGKTTLAAEFLGEWGRFVSDELLALTVDSKNLYPFPKPLNLDVEQNFDGVRNLNLTDSDGRRFRYGLPQRSILNESVSVDQCYFYSLNRTEGATTSFEGMEKGKSFLGLQEFILKPHDSELAFERLAEFYDPDLVHSELRYSDTSQLTSEELFEP